MIYKNILKIFRFITFDKSYEETSFINKNKNNCTSGRLSYNRSKKSEHERISNIVRNVVKKHAEKSGMGKIDVTTSQSLITDLGYTSLNVVNLIIEVEKAIGIKEFPVQEWIDVESVREDKRFSVESLVRMCVEAKQNDEN